jgi:hypothetical protein
MQRRYYDGNFATNTKLQWLRSLLWHFCKLFHHIHAAQGLRCESYASTEEALNYSYAQKGVNTVAVPFLFRLQSQQSL